LKPYAGTSPLARNIYTAGICRHRDLDPVALLTRSPLGLGNHSITMKSIADMVV
jgi:hypothetical protein